MHSHRGRSASKILGTIFLVAALVFSNTNTAQGASHIRIGIFAPLTGPLATVGSPFARGAEALIDAVKSTLDLSSHTIEYLTIDTSCKADVGHAAATTAIFSDMINVAIHLPCGGASTVSDLLKRSGIATIEVGTYSPNTTKTTGMVLPIKMGNDVSIYRRIENRLTSLGIETGPNFCYFFGQGLRYSNETAVICAYRGEQTFSPSEVVDRLKAVGIQRSASEDDASAFPHGVAAGQVLLAGVQHSISNHGNIEPNSVVAAIRGLTFDTVLGNVEFDAIGNDRKSEFTVLPRSDEMEKIILKDAQVRVSDSSDEDRIQFSIDFDRVYQGPEILFGTICITTCTKNDDGTETCDTECYDT